MLIFSLFLAFSLPLKIRLFTKSNLVHKTVRKPQNSLVPSHCAALGSNLAELFALEIKWMKIKTHRQQFQTLLSKITLATLRRAPPPSGDSTEQAPWHCSHLARHSPDSNGHVFFWLEVVITGVIQTLILWFFQVNEIGNPHCGGQRDENQD